MCIVCEYMDNHAIDLLINFEISIDGPLIGLSLSFANALIQNRLIIPACTVVQCIKKDGSTSQVGMGQVQKGHMYIRYGSSSMKNKASNCKN